MTPRNIFLFFTCIFINLLIGNVALFMFPDLTIIYHILISLSVFFIYGAVFYRLNSQSKKYTQWKFIGFSVLLSLLGMLVACIFTSIGTRLPMDNMITAGMKGIFPMFIFALIFASPFWIAFALVNFACLSLSQKIGDKRT